MKILISAYACEPNKGSEPGIGWNMVLEVAKRHCVWVLTSNTHKEKIEAEMSRNPVENLKIAYADPLGWIYDWSNEGKRVHWNIHLHYYLWQIQAYLIGRSLNRKVGGFDLVHHLTYTRYSTPSFLSLLPIPFIWGPLAGGEVAPQKFIQDLNQRGKVYEFVRAIAARLGEFDPFVRLTARRSAVALAATEDTARRLHKIGASQAVVIPSVALSDEDIHYFTENTSQNTPKTAFISIGRLLHWKGFHLGLKAFSKASLSDEVEYWIVGDGPERERLAALAEDLGVSQQVKFLSQLPRLEVLRLLSGGLALVHPSLHESGGFVCLEAMAAGCPVICLDSGGPALQVTEETGFKVLAQSPEQVVQGIARAMTTIALDSELRKQLGDAGRKRVIHSFTWRSKGEIIDQYYQKIFKSS